MTKRRRRSGGDLRRHIEAAVKNCSTVEELLDHLRSSYPHYTRTFTKLVERVIMLSSRSNDAVVNSNEGGDIKRRKIDSKEENLQLIDVTNYGSRGGCSSSASAISSGGDSSDEEASTSDDAIYDETLEPNFDLMKSMMRENLARKSKKFGEGRAVNKEAVELEVVENKGLTEVTLMTAESELGEKSYRNNLNENDRNRSSKKNENVSDKLIFKDLWGISGAIEELELKILAPLNQEPLNRHLGGKPATGFLLHGPPGCGKTKLARATANVPGVTFYEICATELVSGVSGESEENIRELFSKAYRTAPSIVFIDEIDAIASKRSNSERAMETRIVTQLLNSMNEPRVPVGDDVGSDCRPGHVVVIAATNRPHALDPALRRPGRFTREIELGVPDEAARIEILSMLIRGFKVEGDLDIPKIARSSSGFVGADLADLVNEAADLAKRRILQNIELSKEEKDKVWWRRSLSPEQIENQSITVVDFEEAAKKVQPSLRREGFSAIPDVKWDDVGGLHLLREEFDLNIVGRIKFPEDYKHFGLKLAIGFLLYGPPGCGKTLIAKAVANEAGANFIHIKGPELMNKYVGESELAVRTIFSRARTCSPCIVFFDEVDALTTKRGGQEGGGVVERVVNQLLIELDDSEPRRGRGVYVIGATNRPEVMDEALLRPGRFGKLMYVPLPSPDERGMILKALARERPIDADVDLIALAKDTRCNNLSGADLSALMDKAAMAALKEKRLSTDRSCRVPQTIKYTHFTSVLQKISPSVSDKQIQHYKLWSEKFGRRMRA